MTEAAKTADAGGEASDRARDVISSLSGSLRESFDADNRLLSYDQFLALVVERPERFARNSAQYLLDALEHFGVEEVVTGRGDIQRYLLFNAPFDEGAERVVGHEATQSALVRALTHFVRERCINRLILIHGPNGSAKSSLVSCLMRALQAYSKTDEGAIYRFNWVFPSSKLDGSRIGFGGKLAEGGTDSYAFLTDDLIDSKLPSEHNDNPLFLLPTTERNALLDSALGDTEFVLSDTIAKGDLGHRSRAVFDALLASYRGGFDEVLRHVQVERFFISKRYRRGAVTVEPQVRVDAAARQLTADRSLNALPQVLQTQTLFEAFGPLVEGNRGIVEYNDLLKRPMDANKYLLSTSEKGTVALDTGEMHIDTVLIATANEKYVDAFKQSPDWPSYKARFSLVRMAYLLDYRAEQEIYDGQLAELELSKPTAPHTTFVAALWAVLTRLVKPEGDGFDSSIKDIVSSMTPLQKALLYADGTLPPGLSGEQSQQLRIAIPELVAHGASRIAYEGRFGASPREIKTVILDAAHREEETLSPLHVFASLRALIDDKSVYEWLQLEPEGDYRKPEDFIDAVRSVYLDRVEREVRDATGLVDDAEYRRLFERYVTHANHSLRNEKIKDEITGTLEPPDEHLMAEVENTIGRDDEAKVFRSNLLSKIAAFRIDNRDAKVDLERIFPEFFEKLREQYFSTKQVALNRIKQNLLAFVDDAQSLDAEDRAQVEQTILKLEEKYGYTVETAKEAIATLLQDRYGKDS